MNYWSEKKITKGEEENRTFEDFQSKHRKTIVEVCWTRKEFEKIVFIDPILKGIDYNEN